METELKLAVGDDALKILEEGLLPKLEADKAFSVSRKALHLQNHYYDTPDFALGHRKMGFRVRINDGKFEQTVKTQGKVEGGLHQRPEYNVELSKPEADLLKFDRDIWADDLDVEGINQRIERLFSTDFTRTQIDIKTDDGWVELVLDMGEVKTDKDAQAIQEIELELKRGKPSLLFDIAEQVIALMPARLSDASKAARGYQLLKGSKSKVKALPKYLPLERSDTTEKGLCKAISCALSHWQYHQALYIQASDAKALVEVREALLLLMQSVSLYLPVLQSDDLLRLHKQLLHLVQQWSWQEDLKSIHQLRSRKGPFCKRIPKNQHLVNYLLGRREGLILAYEPKKLLMSTLSAQVQLSASRLLVETPWRKQTDGADIPVIKHANGWLSQSWQTVMQSLPRTGKVDAVKYLSLEVLLKQSLTNGFLLADLFADSRGHFRAPWLDLLQGIDELKAIDFLQDALVECEIEEPEEFNQWLKEKAKILLDVMERSREVAMKSEVYW